MTGRRGNDWSDANRRYLGAALAWLRLRLVQLAPVPPQNEATPAEPQRRFPQPIQHCALPATADWPAEKALQDAHAEMVAAESTDPPPAMAILAERLGLTRFEQQVLLLCTAMELDTCIAGLCARAQDDAARTYPTFALALSLFDDPEWDVLSPERPLRFLHLIEIGQHASQPLTTSALRADERVVNYLKGLNYLDDRLTPLVSPFDVLPEDSTDLSATQQIVVETIARQVSVRAAGGQSLVVQLVGPDPMSKQLVATSAAAAHGLQLVRVPVESLSAHASELETLYRLWQRETLLLPIAMYVDAHEYSDAPSADGRPSILRGFLTRCTGLVFVATLDVLPDKSRHAILADVRKPTPDEQRSAWRAALGASGSDEPARLAGQFSLNLPTIRRIAGAASDEDLPVRSRDNGLWAACVAQTRPRLSPLAQRLEPMATWDDIVLPDEQRRLLRQIADQVGHRSHVYDEWGFRKKMNRGLGISALFAGQSGTGKTMAAEVIANDLDVDLFRIDLSSVVSKYIGETEKNLRRLFDAAEDGGTLLFFDEADALFGKRSEVKDSHDRYANIEINYLLQRMEAYGGLAVLATNMKQALDQAFTRRLRFIVRFDFPSQSERKEIWRKVFPPDVPTNGLDPEWLARLNLTGGSIHNVALNAAFLAANDGDAVTMPHLLRAARDEFGKLERPINEAHFRWRGTVEAAA